ncbi:DUF6232 family protein [Streptomyces cyaneofuscatus]|uniref:DUF6232 family protein n=1 Tax=Streptomyces cyaneofuscatus TaxID=66883 RepID=UPI00365D82A4
MEGPENPDAARQQSPPKRPPKATGSDRPWHNPVVPPPRPSLPPHLAGGVDLRTSKRLLWVGGAAYPQQNITRVYTFLLTPRRGRATTLFFKRIAIILSVAFALMILSGITEIGSSSDTSSGTGGGAQTIWFFAVVALIYCAVELGNVLTASSHWVLAIDTSGASTALVTSKSVQHLNELVEQVVHWIENPEIEFQVRAETLMVNPSNYHFGDNVNMYGGSGNVGMSKS